MAIFSMRPGEAGDPSRLPVNVVDGRAPAVLLMQGMDDSVVDPLNAFVLQAAIQKAGGEVTLITYPDLGHRGIVVAMAWGVRWLGPVLEDADGFLRK